MYYNEKIISLPFIHLIFCCFMSPSSNKVSPFSREMKKVTLARAAQVTASVIPCHRSEVEKKEGEDTHTHTKSERPFYTLDLLASELEIARGKSEQSKITRAREIKSSSVAPLDCTNELVRKCKEENRPNKATKKAVAECAKCKNTKNIKNIHQRQRGRQKKPVGRMFNVEDHGKLSPSLI